ncbi:MAG TPA: glycosyltransferase [Bryobacteraceae bacterium]|nr:glycosyltransferase [Bryobacteraceae bacterium]
MKVGFYSPLPPARTGVADYSAALLRALAPLGDVEVNARDAEIALYHLGNNRLHREIYERAMERPGVAVLHDAVLHHFYLDALNAQEYIAEFTYNYGAWTEDLARGLWQRCAISGADPDYFLYPMLKRVAERSLGIIVHNPRAAAMVREHAPQAAVYEIPHLFAPPAELAPEAEVIRWRAAHGVAPRTLLAGVFGYLRESKRLASVLRALGRARAASEIALLVAGDFVSSDLERAMKPLLSSDAAVIRIGYVSEREFWVHAAAVDACINLRYPMAGETSGIGIRLMGIGKPVLVTAGEETGRYPGAACLRVDPGPAEEEMLAEYLVWLARYPDDARAVGERARRHIREFHSPERAAALYWQALADCYDRTNLNRAAGNSAVVR